MFKISYKRDQKYHFSPLRYPGGKTCIFPFLGNVIKENKLDSVTYVEPFAGGAGAALALLFLEKVDRIVINDLDKAIYSFWVSAIFESEKFIKKIMNTPVDVKEWKKQKKVNDDLKADIFDIGFSTFYLNRTNLSGVLDARPIGGLEQTGKWKIDARFNKEGLSDRIRQIAEYKNRITVLNEDGLKLIEKYLNRKDVFIYLDPPYFEKGATLYLNHYQSNNHEALAKKLNENPNSFWVLTYDDISSIRTLYSERRIVDFTLAYNVREARRGKELLILSDRLVAKKNN